MEDFWFDARYINIQTGEPLSAEAAQLQLDAGSETVKFLGELLLAEEFPYQRADFSGEDSVARKKVARTWTPEECLAYGSWVRSLIETDTDEPRHLSQMVLRRVSTLGLGPNDVRLLRQARVTCLAEFCVQLGVPVGVNRGAYEHWDVRRLVRYAGRLAAELGRKPLRKDYDAAAGRLRGPSVEQLYASPVSGVERLNELIWYPDTASMDADDMVYWGSRVRMANDGRPLSDLMFKVLSKRKRGPSTQLVYDNFTNWGTFIQRVDDQYSRETEETESARKRKLELYAGMLKSGELPPEADELDEDELFAVGGRYRVARSLTSRWSTEQLREVALQPSREFIPSLQRNGSKLTSGFIETEADILGVFDDIWPLEDDSQFLVVTDAELEKARLDKNVKDRAYAASKRTLR